MKEKIPPLNPLHVFVAAARHCSFTRAAEELNVGQSAVSRQIAVLEAISASVYFFGSVRASP